MKLDDKKRSYDHAKLRSPPPNQKHAEFVSCGASLASPFDPPSGKDDFFPSLKSTEIRHMSPHKCCCRHIKNRSGLCSVLHLLTRVPVQLTRTPPVVTGQLPQKVPTPAKTSREKKWTQKIYASAVVRVHRCGCLFICISHNVLPGKTLHVGAFQALFDRYRLRFTTPPRPSPAGVGENGA